MNKSAVLVKISVLLIILVSFSGCLKPEINVNSLELKIHDLVNNERIQNGLQSLEYDNELANIARAHSIDMANRNFFSHTNPDGLGPTERANAAGYRTHKDFGTYYVDGIGENICQENILESGYDICFIPLNDWNDENELAKSVVDLWMTSPGHRQNILTSTYDVEGIGVAIASDNKVYVTQDFW